MSARLGEIADVGPERSIETPQHRRRREHGIDLRFVPLVVASVPPTSDQTVADGGGDLSQRRNVSCGLQADTTIGAVIWVPSDEGDAADAFARAHDRVDGALGAQRAASSVRTQRAVWPVPVRFRRRGGRPCRRGASHASVHPARCPASPVMIPHTIGPVSAAGAHDRFFVEVRAQDVCSAPARPAHQRAGATETVGAARAGRARRRSAVRPQPRRSSEPQAPQRRRIAGNRRPEWGSAGRCRRAWPRGRRGATSPCRRRRSPTRSCVAPVRGRCTRGPAPASPSSSITGVVRKVRWSQLQMLTVAPANCSLAAVPPTSDRASTSRVDMPARARYAAVTRPLWPAPITTASKSAARRSGSGRNGRHRAQSLAVRCRRRNVPMWLLFPATWPNSGRPTWPDLVTDRSIFVQPLGAIEQHGPHLPFNTDLLIADRVSQAAIERVGADLDVWLLPSLAYTKSNEHAWSSGTIWLSATTLLAVLDDIGRCVATTQARKLVFFNGHGGNSALVGVANREIRLAHGLMTFLAHPGVPPDQGGVSAPDELGHGHPRWHRRDVDHAASRSGSRRHVRRHPQRARAACRQSVRPLRRIRRLRLVVERLRPRRPHRRPDIGHRRARCAAVRAGGRRLLRGARRGRHVRAADGTEVDRDDRDTTNSSDCRVDTARLLGRIDELGQIGRIDGPNGEWGNARLALTDADRDGTRSRRRLDARPRPRRGDRRDRQRRRDPGRRRPVAGAR